jgi:hypothetical protein
MKRLDPFFICQVRWRPGDSELLGELEARGLKVHTLLFYRCLYEAGVVEQPPRLSYAAPPVRRDPPTPFAAS